VRRIPGPARMATHVSLVSNSEAIMQLGHPHQLSVRSLDQCFVEHLDEYEHPGVA
jgi:hypothetical protein